MVVTNTANASVRLNTFKTFAPAPVTNLGSPSILSTLRILTRADVTLLLLVFVVLSVKILFYNIYIYLYVIYNGIDEKCLFQLGIIFSIDEAMSLIGNTLQKWRERSGVKNRGGRALPRQ